MNKDNRITLTTLRFTTPHYKFKCIVREEYYPLHKLHLLVGDEKKPCLDCVITLENRGKNNRYDSIAYTANLNQIDALLECSLEDITDDYMAKYSFGTELLDAIVFFINSQGQPIRTVSLDDRSYIPCIRETNDTLDLLTYSIALYGKTWYEIKLNAYLKPESKYNEYRRQVDIYMSKETKLKMNYSDIYGFVLKGSRFTIDIFDRHEEEFMIMFHESKTLPDFFKAISKKVERTEKCRFFKYWLERIIMMHIRIERTWYFDLFPKIEIIEQRNINGKNITRKNKRKL
jgi:hypothetical protein